MKKTVLVVGTGSAAFCAAISAAESGAKVTMLEAAAENAMGGNSRYTAGAFRFFFENEKEVFALLEGYQDKRLPKTRFGNYTKKQFLSELQSINFYQGDQQKQKILVEQSQPTIAWLKSHGLKLEPIYHRQCYQVDGIFQFWGGLVLATPQEGVGLIAMEKEIALGLGVEIIYQTRAKKILLEKNKVIGVLAIEKKQEKQFFADSVILACGGFEANKDLRSHYMGKMWEKAKVRGTRYNQGDGILMAKEIGASLCGKKDGCHAVFMDYNTPDYCENVPHLERKKYRKISYPFGIMLNQEGNRFVDEGADLRNYTYAKYGYEVLKQKNQLAWQIFDSKVHSLLYDEYQVDFATKVRAETIEELLEKMDDIDKKQAYQTIVEYNAAVQEKKEFNPTIKDGRETQGLKINKKNWANKIDTPPFFAYKVTCGITFTYMGVATNEKTQVLDKNQKVIAGLFSAGEMLGGIFHHNYPGGSGLTSGAVFGKIAGKQASS